MTTDLVLATDLDGTFLGGSDDQRARLYRWIEGNRDSLALIFVTGRDLPHVRHLCDDQGVPWPDYVIGDVGTTIVAGRNFEPVQALESWVSGLWADRGDRVRAALADEPGLTLQPTPFRHRVSYYYDPQAYDPTVADRIAALGLDCLISADTYLDVLPPGVSKGPTLRRLVDHLGLRADSVLVAGDTLNDLSLFQAGFAGVAVSNAEPALLPHIEALAHVYRSPHPGAAGIQDAIARFQAKGKAAE